METPLLKTRIDARPLVTALERIAAAGRARLAGGTDDAAVDYARLANDALAWMAADEADDLPTAITLMEKIHHRRI